MDGVRLNEEQAAIANRIKDIDRELDELDERSRQFTKWGLHGSGAGVGALAREREQSQGDDARARLQSQRDSLSNELRASIERSRD